MFFCIWVWWNVFVILSMGWFVVWGFNATFTAKVISWRSVTHVCFLAFSTSTNTTFLSKATDYFSHMPLQRWEAKTRRKEKSPQPGIELTITRSWVWRAHHWATQVGRYSSKKLSLMLFQNMVPPHKKMAHIHISHFKSFNSASGTCYITHGLILSLPEIWHQQISYLKFSIRLACTL